MLSPYLVTVEEYEYFLTWAGLETPDDHGHHPRCPVVNVSWNDSMLYAAFVNGRLPSEEELIKHEVWSREPNFSTWPLDILPEVDSHEEIVTADGIYGLIGFVHQWTSTTSGTDRVCRGGGWNSDPSWVRVALRNWIDPSRRDFFLGFRLAFDR